MEQSSLRDSQGRPIWALKGLISFIATAAARLTPDAIVIGFDSPGDSVRKVDYPDYKAQRAEKPPDLRLQLPIRSNADRNPQSSPMKLFAMPRPNKHVSGW